MVEFYKTVKYTIDYVINLANNELNNLKMGLLPCDSNAKKIAVGLKDAQNRVQKCSAEFLKAKQWEQENPSPNLLQKGKHGLNGTTHYWLKECPKAQKNLQIYQLLSKLTKPISQQDNEMEKHSFYKLKICCEMINAVFPPRDSHSE